ncbi:MAG TPA: MtnX-like HAD-IB family phosphatase [Anaeromyxobacteraceae bacterium]|nr:MtnX-like HAD-IB family phosphatase [Anaeromyxobacteraceae bacterium]
MTSAESWAVVCDFDGTATLEDTADALSIAYIGFERWKRANDAFHAGESSFEQLLRDIFEPIAASPAEVRAFALSHVRFRAGFERLVRTCRARRVPFLIASGGLDIYIRPALEKLPRELRDDLEVRANHAEYVPGGLSLSFPFAHAEGACGTCGSCKGAVVEELRRQGRRVVAVGDGNADRCMARVADVVFARDRLLAWCEDSGYPCTPFETLDPVAERIARCGG